MHGCSLVPPSIFIADVILCGRLRTNYVMNMISYQRGINVASATTPLSECDSESSDLSSDRLQIEFYEPNAATSIS